MRAHSNGQLAAPDASREALAAPPSSSSPSRRRAAWRWPAILLALLGGHAAICVAMIVVATNDPSFAVEPEYYTRALDWDDRTIT